MARGVLIVDGILDAQQLTDAQHGLRETLLAHGCDPDDLMGTGEAARESSVYTRTAAQPSLNIMLVWSSPEKNGTMSASRLHS